MGTKAEAPGLWRCPVQGPRPRSPGSGGPRAREPDPWRGGAGPPRARFDIPRQGVGVHRGSRGCPGPPACHPTATFYREPLPLPHLAIYCCNLLTSNMLHNRPHSGQGRSPGLLPAARRGPMGPGAEGSPLPPPTTCFPPRLGEPRLGAVPFTNTSSESGGWGSAVS